jgi:hypothetical protein
MDFEFVRIKDVAVDDCPRIWLDQLRELIKMEAVTLLKY